MDSETGELFTDNETGESSPIGRLNSETGEMEVLRKSPDSNNKRPFRIPPSYMKPPASETDDSTDIDENSCIIKKIIFANTNPLSPIILYLLPTLFLFIPAVVIPMSIIEMVLHQLAHRRNNLLRSNNINNVYYQSPMHIYVSQFCAACKYESSKEMIGKLQDKWNKRFIKYGLECVKQVV